MGRLRARDWERQLAKRFRQRFGGRGGTADPLPGEAAARARQQEIAELAEAVAAEHAPAGRIDPEPILCGKRMTYSFGDYGDAFDGMLEWRTGRFHIYCNLTRTGNPASPRSRFTLAHELGHYFIDEHRQALAGGRVPAHTSHCEYESSLAAEQEADTFAAHLLMPTERFRQAGTILPPGLGGIVQLAETFGASLTASAIRYAALDLFPCAVVKWDWRGYAWKYLSTSAFRAHFRRTFESAADLAAGSPTRLALDRQSPPQRGYFQAGTVASAWFPGTTPGNWQDAIFIEEAVPLGRYGVLTFLYPADGSFSPRP